MKTPYPIGIVACSAEGAAVRFGLSAVRGAGKGAMDAIIEERERGGKFKDLFEFCERVDLRKVNKGALEALIKAGAFDFSGVARGAMAAVLEKAINAGANKQKNAKAGLKSMFELPSAVANGAAIAQITYPDVSWTQKERLTFEKESLGFYLSGHPLDAYSDILPKLISHNGAMIAAMNESRDEVTIAGVLLNVEDRPTKSGKGRYARGIIDMKDHRVKFMLFGKAYESCLEAIEKTDEPLLISGSVEVEEKEIAGGEDEETTTVTDITFRPEKMEPLANIRRKSSRKLVISLPGDVKEQTLKKIRDMLRGSCTSDAQCSRVSLVFKDLHKEARVYANRPPFFKIAADENLIEELRKLVGRDAVYTE